MIITYINNPLKYTTLKELLKQEFKISDRLLFKLKQHNKIYLNHVCVSINSSIKLNDLIKIVIDFEEDSPNIIAQKLQLDILFEDDSMLILNKPASIAVHPSLLHFDNTLSNGVKYYFNSIGLKKKIRIVNRLDKDTSGIVIFAKNEYVQENLIQQMKSNTFKKYYIAIVEGLLEKNMFTINAPISRKEGSIIERCVNKNGAISITQYHVIKKYSNYSLVYINLLTGRTHQIRVHMSYIKHPILGDTLYGNSSNLINRQALHACKVNFIHPITNLPITIESNISEDIKNLIV